MIRYLTLRELIELYYLVIEQSGGTAGIRDSNAIESSLAQPQMTFGEEELYPDLVSKASALGYGLIMNHPFIDGNKRIGHAAMETFLVLNDHEIQASADDQEAVILSVAAGEMRREAFTEWLRDHVVALPRLDDD